MHNDPNEEFLEEYATKRRSIYVGGLPADVTEDGLTALFAEVGNVRSVQIVNRASYHTGPGGKEQLAFPLSAQISHRSAAPRVFAFVEFDRPDVPDAAIKRFVSCPILLC